VQIGVDWYESFNTPNADGTLPAPSGNYSQHCIAAYEVCSQGLRIKSWQGPNVGDHGYLYVSETNFNLVFNNAAAFNLQAWRWGQLALTGAFRPYLINDILPQLQATSGNQTDPIRGRGSAPKATWSQILIIARNASAWSSDQLLWPPWALAISSTFKIATKRMLD
jgi:hypothetical protein